MWPQLCLPLCPLECEQAFYKKSISFNRLNGDAFISHIKKNQNLSLDFVDRQIDSINARESFVSVKVLYESLSNTLTSESIQMDRISLFGSIGGNLGLFLGVSLFSLWEIIEVFIEIYYNLKRRNKNR